ncbi:MAG TPA: hypothetical protein VKX39_14980 [Bryobacteraceae bacterium]|jgi:hypothetical protein|nr:hypothetical protein [Bryobacteraceae bacterium]
MKRAAALLLAARIVSAAEEKKHKPELPEQARTVISLARATAPEFFAKAITDLVRRGAIPDRESRADLLEEAFAIAPSAKEPFAVVAIPATPPDTRELHRAKAAELKLDALSLEAAIVKEMVRIDPAKARAMFDEIARPVVDPRPCEDPLIPDVSAYYEMAGVIAQSAFTPAEKQIHAHVQFLQAVLDGARSPGELPAFLRLLQTVALTREQRELLAGSFAAKLASIGVDDRAFAVSYNDLKLELDRIAPELDGALARYTEAQTAAARCGPAFVPGLIYFQSGDSKRIADQLIALRNIPHDDPQWRSSFADLLRDLSFWNRSEIDEFHQQATMLRALLDGPASGEDRNRLLAYCAGFLAAAAAQREHPQEWLYQVQMLDRDAKMKDLFRASGNAALLLYANYFSASNGTSK